jgi:hypothetical protein
MAQVGWFFSRTVGFIEVSVFISSDRAAASRQASRSPEQNLKA